MWPRGAACSSERKPVRFPAQPQSTGPVLAHNPHCTVPHAATSKGLEGSSALSICSWSNKAPRLSPNLTVQDVDSGHHGSGFPLPLWRRRLLEQFLTRQVAAAGGTGTVELPGYANGGLIGYE